MATNNKKPTKARLNRKFILKLRDEIVKNLIDANNKGASAHSLIKIVYDMLTKVSDFWEVQ